MGGKGGYENNKNIMSKIWVENGYRTFNGFTGEKQAIVGIV